MANNYVKYGTTQFFNPRVSMVTLSVSLVKGCIQVAMAKALDSNFSGRPQKGQKIYNWEKTNYFSLSDIECATIYNSLDDLLDGKYVNQQEKNEAFKNILSVTHFRENQPYKLLLQRHKDQDGNFTRTLVLGIVPPKDSGFPSTHYIFRGVELLVFREFIRKGYVDLPYDTALEDARQRALRATPQDGQGNKQGNGNNQSSNQSSNQSNQSPQSYSEWDDIGGGAPVSQNNDSPPKTESQPKTESKSNSGTTTNVDGIDFEW